jgi:hypothetical protein
MQEGWRVDMEAQEVAHGALPPSPISHWAGWKCLLDIFLSRSRCFRKCNTRRVPGIERHNHPGFELLFRIGGAGWLFISHAAHELVACRYPCER